MENFPQPVSSYNSTNPNYKPKPYEVFSWKFTAHFG